MNHQAKCALNIIILILGVALICLIIFHTGGTEQCYFITNDDKINEL